MRPAPETATGKLIRRQAKRKGRNWHWETCGTCNGRTNVRDRFNRERRCQTCRGRGRRAVDDYTGAEVVVRKSEAEEAEPTAFGMSWGEEFAYLLERDTKTTTCPHCVQGVRPRTRLEREQGVTGLQRCEPCRGSGRVPIAGSWLSDPLKQRRPGGDAVDVQLDELERRDELGDWRQAEAALVELRRRAPKCYRVFSAVYMLHERELDDVDELEEIALRGALLYLDWLLPLPLIVPRWIADSEERRREHLRTVKGRGADQHALNARNKEIERDLRQEKPLQWIADHYDISLAWVYELRKAMKRRAQDGGS